MRVIKSDMANSPKMFISSGEKCNMFSKFWMAPSAHHFNKFSLEITCFSFGQEVASPSLPVVSHKRNLLIYISLEWHPVCWWTVSFFCVSSHFTTAVFVFLSMLIICPRWIQCLPWFSTLTQSPSQMDKASKLVDSFFFAPKVSDMIQNDTILHKQLPSPCSHSSSPIMSFIWPKLT